MTITFAELRARYGVDGIEARDWVFAGLVAFVTVELQTVPSRSVTGLDIPNFKGPDTIEELRSALRASQALGRLIDL